MSDSLAEMAPGEFLESLNASSPDFKTLSPAQPLGERATPNGPSPDGPPPSTATATKYWWKEQGWAVGNGWAVACSPQAGDPYPYWTQQMMLGGPGGEDGGVNFTLADRGCTLSPGNNQYHYAFEMNNTTDKTNFLSYLADPNFRHCYFFGDGSATGFGSGRNNVLITLKNLGNTLGNAWSNNPALGQVWTTAHPFRLVFIDACSSAKGNLCEGFGIPALHGDYELLLELAHSIPRLCGLYKGHHQQPGREQLDLPLPDARLVPGGLAQWKDNHQLRL